MTKFGIRSTDRLNKAFTHYNVLFNELKNKALTMKSGLSEDSPATKINEFANQFLDWETELKSLANQLHDKQKEYGIYMKTVSYPKTIHVYPKAKNNV